ncbi:HNH endonuclease [Bdellovibrio sp. HCB2-146]|uniref:HNH endonuclease n=1 Tax=Bdellovibrio sp. HCB2-146 TaxID=3394362 RepID=UPI0039BD6D97
MDLSKLSNVELVGRLQKLARAERKITHLILLHINEVESRRLYAKAGRNSMFKYLTKDLGYSEDSAYRRLNAARLLKQVPQVAEKLEDGSLNLTQLTQVQKCIREEAKSGGYVTSEQTIQILEQVENKSTFETKKVLAVEFNQPIQMHEVIKPQRDNSIRAEMSFTEEQHQVIHQVKDLLSHVMPDGNLSDLFTYLAKKELQRIMGKESATTEKKTPTKLEAKPSTPRFLAKRKREGIRITVKRALLKKADNCCQFVNPKTQVRCDSTYQLQIDHRTPVAFGGGNEVENLRVLCRTHNLLEAERVGLNRKID